MTSRRRCLLAGLALPVFLAGCGGTSAGLDAAENTPTDGTGTASVGPSAPVPGDLGAALLPADRFVPDGVATEVDPASFAGNDPRSFPADGQVTPAECATALPADTAPAAAAAAQDVNAPDGGAWSQLLRDPAAGSALTPASMADILAGCPAAAFTLTDGTEFALTFAAIDAASLGDEMSVQVADIETTVGGVASTPLSAYVASVVDGDRLMIVTWLRPQARTAEDEELFLARVAEAYDYQHASLG